MALGFGLLRLSPDGFWAMTPRELAAAAAAHDGLASAGGAPQRQDILALMARYPDIAKDMAKDD